VIANGYEDSMRCNSTATMTQHGMSDEQYNDQDITIHQRLKADGDWMSGNYDDDRD